MKERTLIAARELARLQRECDLLLVDCRFDLADAEGGARAYLAGHLPGAVYASLDHDLSDLGRRGLGRHPLPTDGAFSAVLSRWGWHPGLPVVAYDASSGALAAARLWWMLRLADQPQVAVLDGGLAAWQAAGLPLESGSVRRAARSAQVQLDLDQVVWTGELEHRQIGADILLLDARAAVRFRGEQEPLDPRAGHIPGALNRPLAENLDTDGCFKSVARLRTEFAALLGDRAPDEVVHSCGSGVTACHNLLAMEHAGLRGSRVYAPSWSGWSSDPEHAVAVGP